MSYDAPAVTVAVPMYQGGPTIERALRSIQNQTFRDVEIVVVDDGSTDDSVQKVISLGIPGLRLFRNTQNEGLGFTRNRLLAEARGRYLAWLDQDDICLPKRVGQQVSSFERDTNLVLSSGWSLDRFSGLSQESNLRPALARTNVLKKVTVPSSSRFIRTGQGLTNLLTTSACMIRLDVVRRNGIRFDGDLAPAEDYGFWNELLNFGRCEILRTFLCELELRDEGASRLHSAAQQSAALKIGSKYLSRQFFFAAHQTHHRGYEILCFRPNLLSKHSDADSVWLFVRDAIREAKDNTCIDFRSFSFFLSLFLQRLIRHQGLLQLSSSPRDYLSAADILDLLRALPSMALWKMNPRLAPR